jgi:CRP/FNR family cyclic AMP-dependent transcriptional regulator
MDNVPTVRYGAGEIIITEGEPSNSVYLVISGKVEIFKNSNSGKLVVLAEQGKNTIFGEMTLIDGKRRSASVKALEDTYCYKCNSGALIQEIAKLDEPLRVALQSMVATIREHNKAAVASGASEAEGFVVEDYPDLDALIMTEEEVKSESLQKKVEELSNPFLKSLFRVLMDRAFH